MGNPHRGDTPIEVGEGSNKQQFTLCYDLNACAMVMKKLGVNNLSSLSNGTQLSSVALDDIIYVLWAGLQRHHPELTEKEVGALEWDLAEATGKIGEAFVLGLTRNTKPEGQSQEKADPQNRGTGNAPK